VFAFLSSRALGILLPASYGLTADIAGAIAVLIANRVLLLLIDLSLFLRLRLRLGLALRPSLKGCARERERRHEHQSLCCSIHCLFLLPRCVFH